MGGREGYFSNFKMSRGQAFEKWISHYGLELVRSLAEEGLGDDAIAEKVGLSPSQMRIWKEKHPEFREALLLGHADSDYHVINALYKKATGFNVELKKTYKLKTVEFDPDTGKKIREYEELATGVDETFIPADLSAEKYWLENRRKDQWGNREEEDEEEKSEGAILLVEADAIDCYDGEVDSMGANILKKKGHSSTEDGYTDVKS